MAVTESEQVRAKAPHQALARLAELAWGNCYTNEVGELELLVSQALRELEEVQLEAKHLKVSLEQMEICKLRLEHRLGVLEERVRTARKLLGGEV